MKYCIVDSNNIITNINIIDENDTVVATRKWWGVEYDESNENMYEEDPISYGKFGYYTSWIEY